MLSLAQCLGSAFPDLLPSLAGEVCAAQEEPAALRPGPRRERPAGGSAFTDDLNLWTLARYEPVAYTASGLYSQWLTREAVVGTQLSPHGMPSPGERVWRL